MCLHEFEFGFLILFNSRLNADILGENLLTPIDLLRDSSVVIYKRDNAQCHTAIKVNGLFEDNVDVTPSPWLHRNLAKILIANLKQNKSKITK